MTPAARATVLLLAVAAAGISFVLGATVAYLLAVREPRQQPRHRKVVAARRHRHRQAPRHEWLKWAASALVAAFSVLIGVSQ